MKVWKIRNAPRGYAVILDGKGLDVVMEDIKLMEVGDRLYMEVGDRLYIDAEEMDEEKFKNLPEFTGW